MLEQFIGSGATVTTLLLVGVLSRKWLVAFVARHATHDFDVRLETHKNDLAKDVEAVRQLHETNESRLGATLSGFLTSNAAAYSRREKALFEVWEFALDLFNAVPIKVRILDLRGWSPKNIDPETETWLKEVNLATIAVEHTELVAKAERVRPAVDPSTYARFRALTTIAGRATFETIAVYQRQGELPLWWEADPIRELLKSALTGRQKDEFAALKKAQLDWTTTTLLNGLAEDIWSFVTGHKQGDEAKTYAKAVMQFAAIADQETTKEMSSTGQR